MASLINYPAASIGEMSLIINQTFTVVGADNKMFDMALKIDNNDLEDAVQYVCAYVGQCSLIVSNDKKFHKRSIEVLGGAEFMKRYVV